MKTGLRARKNGKGKTEMKILTEVREGNEGLDRLTDTIGKAFAREREARFWPVWPTGAVVMHAAIFKCVCCDKHRRSDERREPDSEVCIRCERAAGYLN